jgi:hypothetical protein
MLTQDNKWTPVCPNCGSNLEWTRTNTGTVFVCTQCDWINAQSRRAASSFVALIPSTQEAQSLFGNVLSISRPRPMTWSRPSKIAATVLLICLCFDVWLLSHFHPHSQRGVVNVLTLIVLASALPTSVCFPLLPEFSKTELIRSGEASVGRVILQVRIPRGRGNAYWMCTSYAFLDAAGRGFIGKGKSCNDGLGTGAPLVVFYDPLDPKRNIALDCSRISVKLE